MGHKSCQEYKSNQWFYTSESPHETSLLYLLPQAECCAGGVCALPPGYVGGVVARSDQLQDLQGQECHDGRQISHPSLPGDQPYHAVQEGQGEWVWSWVGVATARQTPPCCTGGAG